MNQMKSASFGLSNNSLPSVNRLLQPLLVQGVPSSKNRDQIIFFFFFLFFLLFPNCVQALPFFFSALLITGSLQKQHQGPTPQRQSIV
jgi:hypothetical protein